MTDPTPLQRIDDAIHEFATTMGDSGDVNAWVLVYELSRINPDPGMVPLTHSAGYTIGPSTSPATAAGLAEAMAAMARGFVIDSLTSDQDEDEDDD